MNKAIVISIKPEYVAKILNGDKIIELRKTAPRCALPIDVYIYCTKDKNEELWWYDGTEDFRLYKKGIANERDAGWHLQNGKVVAKFTLKKTSKVRTMVDHISRWFYIREDDERLTNILMFNRGWELKRKAAMKDLNEIREYYAKKYHDSWYWDHREQTCGYAWHISDLEIFENPVALKKHPPQNWRFMDLEELL